MGAGRALVSSTAGAARVTLPTREKRVTKAMNKHTNKQKKRPLRRSPRQANTVRFPLPFVMLLCWMRSYAGDEECSCGASPDYEIDSFVNAEGLLEAEGPGEKDQVLLSSLEQQRNGAFAVYQTFLVCRHYALQLFTDLYGEQDAQQALSPPLLGISKLTVTVGREQYPRGMEQSWMGIPFSLQIRLSTPRSVQHIFSQSTSWIAILRAPEGDLKWFGTYPLPWALQELHR